MYKQSINRLSTQTAKTVGDNIVTIFGSKFFKTLTKVEIEICPLQVVELAEDSETEENKGQEENRENGLDEDDDEDAASEKSWCLQWLFTFRFK